MSALCHNWTHAHLNDGSVLSAFAPSGGSPATTGDPINALTILGVLGAGGAMGKTWSVALYDETGRPCVTFGYPKETDAKAGREHIKTALIGVASVTKVRDNERTLSPIEHR
jgi:hypothetical protein